jgi:phenylalanine-4-hydroxylase
MDHAGWRFIMALSKDFFRTHAHGKYLSGLAATGIRTEGIPRIEEMDKCLRKFGWRAAVVSGFIPPAIFLEFLSLGILPIACDMRTPEHLHYTPAPDIVHEAAGHAPILADPEYANYIRKYGEVSQKVIFSKEDLAVYNAIRELSDIKEDPSSTPEEIALASTRLDQAVAEVSYASEATQLSRMAWWTIEYGLVGPLDKPLIYGAGLLSSVSESYDCFVKNVKKIPLTLDCIHVSYDITKPQPQLFVTPNFRHLVDVLEEFSQTMSYRASAEKGLRKAFEAQTVTTTEWENGLQVSGVIEKLQFDDWMRPNVIRWKSFGQISFKGKEILGPKRFRQGLTAVVGTPAQGSFSQTSARRWMVGKAFQMTFDNGLEVSGKISEVAAAENKKRALIFREARVGGALVKDVVVVLSGSVASVFGEAADRAAFYDVVPSMHEPKARQKTNLTVANKGLNRLYGRVRSLRGRKAWRVQTLEDIHGELEQKFPSDWLLRMEILELLHGKSESSPLKSQLKSQLRGELESIGGQEHHHRDLIQRGLKLFS